MDPFEVISSEDLVARIERFNNYVKKENEIRGDAYDRVGCYFTFSITDSN